MKTHLLHLIAFTALSTAHAQPAIQLQSYITGLTNPVDIVHCGDDRLFIVQRNGIIRIIDGQGNLLPTPFLDIDARVNSASSNEQGLLGLAFHPDYASNGYFFISYIYEDTIPGNSDRNTRISRFKVTANPDVADPNSEEIVLPITQPFNNHNGGDLAFGPDGYLYIPLGDGGDGGDPGDRAQNRTNLLGKVLRIDVDSLPYSIPPDNPFVNDPNTADEIWAIGTRNPWRFSFDRITGDMWFGDVGQETREEVNFQPASSTGGENYGWRCYEGNVTYNTTGCAAIGNYDFPVFDYDNNSIGCSVVGGMMYRGCQFPNLFGYYVFCDYCSGRFWEIHDSSGTWVTQELINSDNFRYACIGEDVFGELYVAGHGNGTIYKLVETTGSPANCDITISGNITTEVDSPVAGVTVILSGAMRDTVVTDADGFYSFTVTAGGSYTVTPSKANDVVTNNGVTTLDIAFIRRHILGGPLLASPYRIIAADGSNNVNVSTLDIALTRNVVLNNNATFPGGRLWEFVSGFEDAQNPFSFINSRTLKNILSNQTGQDFTGVKLGDVDNSWEP